MAEVTDKVPENVAGKFYVDSNCIDCDLCRDTAPGFFRSLPGAAQSIVYRQPENAEEEKQCEEAKAACPVEAIGNDG